jgi:hypothetical protein
LTTEAYPTFWFYDPFGQASGVTEAEFVLKHENGSSAMRSLTPIRVPLPKEPGLVRFKLPATEPGLSVGKRYNWFFALACSRDRLTNPFVSGWVNRVAADPALQNELKATPPQDHYAAYFKKDIWYDAVDHLAQYHTLHSEEWRKLLTLFMLPESTPLPTTTQHPPAQQTPQAKSLSTLL